MKIIFVNRFFFPDHSASSQMLTDLAISLAAKGHAIGVITSRLRYDVPSPPFAAHESVAGVEVHRVWTTRFGRRSMLGRMFDYVTFYVFASLRLWRLLGADDVVVAMTDPPLFSLCAAPIARVRGGRLINWLQDIFPETAEALELGHRYGLRLLYRWLAGWRDRSLKHATNVVLGEHMRRRLLALEVCPEHVRLIPNFADGELIKPLAGPNALRAGWGLQERFIVGYSGNLGRAHDVATLLQAMVHLEAEDRGMPASARKIAWLFVGGGRNYESLRRLVAERRLGSVTFKPYQSREKLAESLGVADVHIVSLNPALEGLIVPSKFYAIAAAGRPTLFIGDKEGEIARLIARHRCGLSIGIGEAGALARTLRELAADPSACRAMGERARTAFEADFGRSIAVVRWERLLAELAPPRGLPIIASPSGRSQTVTSL